MSDIIIIHIYIYTFPYLEAMSLKETLLENSQLVVFIGKKNQEDKTRRKLTSSFIFQITNQFLKTKTKNFSSQRVDDF